MPNGFSTAAAGGGGGAVILRAVGTADNTITATLGGKTVEGRIGQDGIFQTKLPGLGLWHVKTESGAYSFEQDVKVYRYGITECWAVTEKPFSECTPAEIQTIAKTGLASKLWQIGDKHLIKMGGGEEIHVQIAGFDHDYFVDGKTKIPLTLVMENAFKSVNNMNFDGATNVGGWGSCYFRTNRLQDIRHNFPEEWLDIITVCQKKTSKGNANGTIVTTADDLFMLSNYEIFGSNGYAAAGEGDAYPIFTDNNSRVKSVNGVASDWWTRSPIGSSSTGFCFVRSDGGYNLGNANLSKGIVLGFCVG